MDYLIKKGYSQVEDPYDNGRICFEVKFVDKTMLHHLLNDERFQFIANDIVYFD